MYKGGDGTVPYVVFMNDENSLSNHVGTYGLVFQTDETIRFAKDGGSLWSTAKSYVSNNTWYRIKITRSSIGVFTVYIKGGSFGDDYVLVDVTGGAGTNPGTDNTYTTSNYFVVDLDPGDEISNVTIGGHRASLHEFVEGTGAYDKKFIPAQSGRGLDVLGSVLQIFGNTTSTSFSATDIALIAAQKIARVGLNYWDATTKKFFTGGSDGSLNDFVPQADKMLATAAIAAIDTGQTADEGTYYWDTTLRKFFRGAADGSLDDFATWFSGQ